MPDEWEDQQFNDLDKLSADLLDEHLAQIKKWGVQVHTPAEWMMFLTEEMGELAKAISEAQFREGPRKAIYSEAIQVATLAMKIAEMSMMKDIGVVKEHSETEETEWHCAECSHTWKDDGNSVMCPHCGFRPKKKIAKSEGEA
jgi:rubrerythrin